MVHTLSVFGKSVIAPSSHSSYHSLVIDRETKECKTKFCAIIVLTVTLYLQQLGSLIHDVNSN